MVINFPVLNPVLTAVSTSLAIVLSLIALFRKGRYSGVLWLTTAAAFALGAVVLIILDPAIVSMDDVTRVMLVNSLAWAGLGVSFLSWLVAVIVVLMARRVAPISPLWIVGLVIGLILFPIALFLSGIPLYVLTLLVPLIVGAFGPPASKKGPA